MANIATSLRVRVGCEFSYESVGDTPAVVLVRPEDAGHRVLSESWSTDPAVPYHDYGDLYGNRPRRLTLPAGRLTMRYNAEVETSALPAETNLAAREVPVQDLPDDALVYTLPSRLCQSDQLADEAWEQFGGVAPGWSRVQAICDWVHGALTFGYGASQPVTSAVDALRARAGVCRDFAQVAVTFCRALNIPARYAFGYLPDIDVPPPTTPMDFCAWFEAYLEDRWWTFDPRSNQRRIGHIAIARGRDAVDTAMVTTYGTARLETMTVWADQIA
jgi:transglutaminase-like putative cysteine protease